MSLIKQFEIRFDPSTSPDVVAYKLYYTPVGGTPLSYSSESSIADPIDFHPETGKVVIDLSSVLPSNLDGNYDIGVAAVDDVGNESGMSKLANVPLDFRAPNQPGALEIVAVIS